MSKKSFAVLIMFFLSLNLVSAVIINSVDADTFSPGKEGNIRIEVKNIFDKDAEDVSLNLKFTNLPFIPIGTSEQSLDEIQEDDEENFVFRVKASPTIVPGDYEIPYTIEYTLSGESEKNSRSGSIGIKVSANPILDYSVSTENPIISQQGKINFKIVNKGFSNARFVSVKILPNGFTLFSDENIYIGEIDSDDFETEAVNVKFTKINPRFQAIVEYIDFDNKQITENIDLPLKVYSEEKALELGIIQQSKIGIYVSIVILVILLVILWRILKKRQKLKRSQRLENNNFK